MHANCRSDCLMLFAQRFPVNKSNENIGQDHHKPLLLAELAKFNDCLRVRTLGKLNSPASVK